MPLGATLFVLLIKSVIKSKSTFVRIDSCEEEIRLIKPILGTKIPNMGKFDGQNNLRSTLFCKFLNWVP